MSETPDPAMRLHKLGGGPPPERETPPPERVVEGAPSFLTHIHYESPDGRLVAGVWEATTGAWRVAYEEWEWCRLRSGRCVITPDGGAPMTLDPGEAVVLEPGFAGVWSVLEDCSKDFVVLLPPPADEA